MNEPHDMLRAGTPDDLEAVNAVIERAVMGWNLPERVKRLSLPLYHYDTTDLDHLRLVLAETDGSIVGVAAWETTDARDTPGGASALLLHGLYVDPSSQGQGIGSRLLDAAEQAVMAAGLDGLLVKAQRDAEPFFVARGLVPLPVSDAERDYAHRMWKPVR